MPDAVWQNGKKMITGNWSYCRPSDCFRIELDSVDRITGCKRAFTTNNDTPEWGNWKLLKQTPSLAPAVAQEGRDNG